jgi:hypothetical protein
MKTADLIASLAATAAPTRPVRVARRIAVASLLGAAVALAVLVGWLGLRPLHEAVETRSFWMKAAYTLALSAAGLILVYRLARPGGRLGAAPAIILAAMAPMAGMTVLEILRTAPAGFTALWLGHSWQSCSFHIVALAAPVYLVVMVVLRRLAPTRLSLAGAAAGLLAGAVGATVYCLYCAETTAAFVVTWYSLGIAACVGIGALLGARLLRW